MQLFLLTQAEATAVIHSVNHANAVPAEVMQEAIGWAVKNNAGFGRIRQRYGMSENNARRVALSAKTVNAKKLEDHAERLAKAHEYSIAFPHELATAVAAKFDVSVSSIQRFRRIWRQGKASPAEQPKQEADTRKGRNRLMGWVDGVRVNLWTVKDFERIKRFEGCKV